MPPKFKKCQKAGGRIRTQTLRGGKYRKVCYPSSGGKPVPGHVARKKKR